MTLVTHLERNWQSGRNSVGGVFLDVHSFQNCVGLYSQEYEFLQDCAQCHDYLAGEQCLCEHQSTFFRGQVRFHVLVVAPCIVACLHVGSGRQMGRAIAEIPLEILGYHEFHQRPDALVSFGVERFPDMAFQEFYPCGQELLFPI